MNNQHSISSMRASIVGILNSMFVREKGRQMTENEKREAIAMVDQLIENSDPTDWELTRHEYLYDDYIRMRQESGTLTPFDLVRPGLSSVQFNTEAEYYAHKMREAEDKKHGDGEHYAFGTKVCTACNQELPMSRFKKRGGGKCNACRCRMYRANKAKKEDTTV